MRTLRTTFIRIVLYLVFLAMALSTCTSCSSMKHGGRDYKGMQGVDQYPKYGHFTVLVYFGFTNHYTEKQ